MAIMKIEDLNASDVVVVVIISKEGVPIIFFSDFSYHAAWYDVISDGIEGDLRDEFFHEACIWFIGENGRCFGFDSVDVAMFDGADIDVDLGEFRGLGIVGGSL